MTQKSGKNPQLGEYSSLHQPAPAAHPGAPGGSDFAAFPGGAKLPKVLGKWTVADLRKPEHKSNREVRKARGQEEWVESEA